MLRVLSRLPLASLGGCAFAVAASVALFVRGPAVDGTTGEHLFAGFAIFAVLGLWIDWARLYPTSRRTVLVSGGALVATFLVAATGAVFEAVEVVFVLLLAVAVTIPLAARALWWLGTRGRSDWAVVSGAIRREEGDRLVVVGAAGDVVELDRDAGELGSCRSVDVAPGSPLALLGRLHAEVAPDPYRSEARLRAKHVLAAALDLPGLRRRLYARARSWALYACLLVPLAWLAVTALTPDPVECHVPATYYGH